MKKKKYQNRKTVILTVIVIALFNICLLANIIEPNKKETYEKSNAIIALTKEADSKEFIYLSDLDYITANNWSYNGWSGHDIQKDKNPEGGTIRVKIDGQEKMYLKGLGVHAKGQLTYDISSLSKEYSRFTAIVGVDASRTAYSDLGITISVSDDGNTWTSLFKRDHIRAGDEASKVDVDISNHTFLRIYIDPYGSNSADHGVIANAKLVTAEYDEAADSSNKYDKVHPLSYYDDILNGQTLEYNIEHNYRLILEREVVSKIGYEEIQEVSSVYPKTKETLDWIFNTEDNSVLEQCIAVGELKDGINFLNTLSDLYDENKESLKTDNGYVYQKMMISMAASFTTDSIMTPFRLNAQTPSYDVVERFRLMKQLFDTNKFNNTNQFKNLPIELIRLTTNDGLRNDEYIWLNSYSKLKGSDRFDYRAYVAYIDVATYNQDKFFNPLYETSYSNMYKLAENGVPYGDNRTLRYWMVLNAGGICWNISRVNQSVARVNGIPSVGIYQPAHEPYLFYTTNNSGKGIWEIHFNVGGWGVAGTTWGGGIRYRLPMNWAGKYFTDQNISGAKGGTSAGYVILAQANLNDYENYTKSVWYNLLANSYKDNQDKLKAYNKSLEIQPLNLDTYDNLINLYISMGDEATNTDWVELANKIIDNYTYFPPASYDLIKVVSPHISDIQDRLVIDQKLLNSLQRANNATDSNTLQKTAVKELSAALLGKAKVDLASFSFDGENAGKIMIDQTYRDYDFELSYSLDGGKTYSEKTTNHIIQLSEEEILSITAANDIKLKMTGTDVVNTIDIIDHAWPTAVYGNDLENRIVDSNLDMEWRLKNEDGSWPKNWTSYEEKSPDLTGNKIVQVRMRSMSNKKFSSPIEFTFTQDTKNESSRYIPVSHLSINSVGSGENTAVNAINGNYNNYWQSGSTKWIEIKLDKPIYLSAIEFVPGPAIRQSNGDYYGRISSATIINQNKTSQNYRTGNMYFTTANTTVGQAKNETKFFDVRSTFKDKTQLIRITFSAYSYASLRGINLYQDLTKEPRPTAGIGYSTTEPTNGNVVARLINKSSESVRITNNGGSDTYVFTEEGSHSFTFEFIDDETGKTGTATATVDWIDKQAPTATIEYDINTATNGSVFATLKPSEDVTITSIDKYRENEDGKVIDISGNVLEDLTIDENGYVIDTDGNTIGNVSPFLHIFRQNGSYTFEFVDKAGNKGETTATVDWIDQTPPEATVFYDITQKTNQDVTARLEFNKENVTVINNNEQTSYTFTKNGEFTFEFKDEAGNIGTKKVAVSWIDKDIPTATPKYSTTKKTNKPVTVTLINPSEEITILNNDGNDTYIFDKNGDFTFEIIDKVGNKALIETSVTWIDKEPPSANIKYSTTEETEKSVTASLVDISEEIKVVNNENKTTYTFKENGSFTFIIEDEAGNRSEIVATVNWIVPKNDSLTSSVYQVTDQKISKIPIYTTFEQFKKNIDVSQEVILQDKNGKTLPNETKIGTNMKLVVGKTTYTLIVPGDVDGNAKLTITDLAKLCLHYMEDKMLEEPYKEAADLDFNTKISINDLAKLQLILIDE